MQDTIKDKLKINRQSNIELLRIIAMIFIIAHHFAVHGGFNFSTDIITVNSLWIQFIKIGGKIGVNIFVLISGYFLINTKTVKTSKAFKLWFQIFSYSVLIYMLFVLIGLEPFGKRNFIKQCLPITYSKWWFASTYFILYLLCPFINKLLVSLDKKSYLNLLIILGVCWCIIPTLTNETVQSNSLLWFIFLYSLSGYIRLHGSTSKIKGITYITLSFIITVITWLSSILICKFEIKTLEFYGMQKLPILIISLLLLKGFLQINIKPNRVINIISSATFGVYLIHDNGYIRPFIWKTIFKNAAYSRSKYLIPYSIFVIAIVFIICTIIELLRIYIFEKKYLKIIEISANKFDASKEKMLSNVNK